MSDVFISYSRRDTEFVRQLFDALNTSQRDAWVDWAGIDYSTKWWEEICAGIEGADNFVLIISPESLQSVYCQREIEHARKHNKRIIPLLYKAIDEPTLIANWYASLEMRAYEQIARTNLEAIKEIQWIDYTKLGDLEKTVAALITTVDNDPEQAKRHTRLLLRIREWESRGRSPDALLRGSQLQEYEAWERAPSQGQAKPTPTEEQHTFIVESRRVEDEQHAIEVRREMLVRRFRVAAVVLAVVGVLAVVAATSLGVVGVQTGNSLATATIAQGEAIRLANIANTQMNSAYATLTPLLPTLTGVNAQIAQGQKSIESLRLVSLASGILQQPEGNAEKAALLSIRALQLGYSPAADAVLVSALDRIAPSRSLIAHSPAGISNVSYSRDGRLLVGNTATRVQVWDSTTGQVVATLGDENYLYKSVSFSPDAKQVLVATHSKVVRVYEVATGKQTLAITESDNVNTATYSPDGEKILTVSADLSAKVWDATTGVQLATFGNIFTIVFGAVYSPDGRYIAAWDGEKQVKIFDGATYRLLRTLRGHTADVLTVAFSADSQFLISASRDTTAKLWSVSFGALAQTYTGHRGTVISVAIDKADRTVMTGSADGTAKLWDMFSGKELRTLNGHTSDVTSVAFAPDGTSVLTADLDGTMRLWGLDARRNSRIFADGRVGATVDSVMFSPDGRYVLSGLSDLLNTYYEGFQLWDIGSHQVVRSYDSFNVADAAYSPDGRVLLADGYNLMAIVYDTATGKPTFTLRGHRGGLDSVAFSPDGKLMLTGDDNGVLKVWDASTGQNLKTLPLHKGSVASIAYSPDGKMLLTGSSDGTAKLWDAQDFTEIFSFPVPSSPRKTMFMPDGHAIVTHSDEKSFTVWDVTTGKKLQTIDTASHTASIRSVDISPDGRYLVTGSYDGTAKLWELATGRELRTYSGHTNYVTSVAFSPDGRYILTGSHDGTVRMWDVDYRDFLLYACSRLYADLSPQDRAAYRITDNTATCSEFVSDKSPMPDPIPSSTALPVTVPAWTPLASFTMTPTKTLAPSRTPFAVASIARTAPTSSCFFDCTQTPVRSATPSAFPTVGTVAATSAP